MFTVRKVEREVSKELVTATCVKLCYSNYSVHTVVLNDSH